jgi:hypothetical protein
MKKLFFYLGAGIGVVLILKNLAPNLNSYLNQAILKPYHIIGEKTHAVIEWGAEKIGGETGTKIFDWFEENTEKTKSYLYDRYRDLIE